MQSRLFDYFIRPRQHIWRNRETNLLRCFQIDDELELLRLLHRQVGGLSTFQNLVDVESGAPKHLCKARAVKHEATSIHKFSPAVYRREPVLCREVCKLCSVRIEHGASTHADCLSTSLVCGSECSLNILRTYYVQVLSRPSRFGTRDK